ncbi:hypothetical protein Tco_1329391 [Tanacetum coccineum]
MSDWKPQCHKRKRYFKWSLILSRTLHASRLSLFLQMSQKSLCSSSGILSRRMILDICPRVEGVNFTDVPDDDTTLAFLIKLGYKGLLYKHTNMFVDHMHRSWRTLAAIINKCLSRTTTRNDKLHQGEKTCHSPVSQRSSSITSSSNTILSQTSSFNTIIQSKMMKQSNNLNPIRCSSSIPLVRFPPRRVEAKVHKERRLLMTLRKLLMYLKSLNLNLNQLRERLLVRDESRRKSHCLLINDPDTALELGKSISRTEAKEAEEARQVHVNHARIMTESIPEYAKKKSGGRSSKSVVIQDTPSALKSKPATLKTKLKGAPSLTPEEQEAADIIQALKESKKTNKRQPGTGGSNEGTDTIPGVPDESTVVSATSSEGTGTKPGVSDEEKDITKENFILEWGLEQESEYFEEDQLDDEGDDHISDTQDTDDEDAETESDEDDIYKYKIRDEEVTDAAKADAKKTSEVKDDAKKTELPPSSSSLSVSSGFGDQFLKLSSDSSLLRVAKLEKDVSNLKKIDLSAEAVAALKTQVLSVVGNYLGSTVGDVFQKELKKHTTDLIQKYSLQQIPESSKKQTSTVDLEQGSEKSASNILKIKREQAEKQQTPKFTIKSTDQATLNEYDQKSALYQTMHANKSFNRNPANHRLYHALMEALIEEENVMDKGVADTIQDHKRKHDDDDDDNDDDDDGGGDEDPPTGPNQGKKSKRRRTKEFKSSKKPSSTKETPIGKALSKGSKTGKSASAKELVEEPIAEVIMDDAGDYVVHDDDQPQEILIHKIIRLQAKWFKQPLRPPTLIRKGTSGDRYLFDLSKPFPLQSHPDHLTVATDYFFNNDLEYLKSSDPKRMYTTSITKTKATQYEIKGIKDMGEGRKLWHRSQLNKFSKHNVYSTKKILGVKSVSVKKLHGYGHLEEIMVKRADRQFYKFKEGDFVDLHLNDIEDMLLLAVQHKLFHPTAILLTLLWLFICSQEVSSSRNMLRIYNLV